MKSSMMARSYPVELCTEIGTVLSKAASLSELLEPCLESLVTFLPVEVAQVWIIDVQHQCLNLVASAGDPKAAPGFETSIPLTCSVIGDTVHDRQYHMERHNHIDPCLLHEPQTQLQYHYEDLTVLVGYPLLVEDKLLGVVALFGRERLADCSLETLGWVASSLAVGIDRLAARDALANRRESILLRLASQIRDSLNLDVILETTVTELKTILKVDWCTFLWCLPGGDGSSMLMLTHEAHQPDRPSRVGDYPPEKTTAISAQILALKPIVIDDGWALGEESADLIQVLDLLAVRSLLVVPLQTFSGQVGAIICAQHDHLRHWTASDQELLQAVVDQVAVAIDQAELYAKTQASALAAQTQAQQLSEALRSLRQTQSQLIQTEKMSGLGQMVAGIAHEINNPVNFIHGNLTYADEYIKDVLELLHLYRDCYPDPDKSIQELEAELDIDFLVEDLQKLLSSMHVGSERIQQIVKSLRNFSRLDEAEMKAVDIHEGIESTLLILHNRTKDRGQKAPGIDIVREYGNLPTLECYPSQLNQVFMNLISNAIDAMEEQAPPRQIRIQTSIITNPEQERFAEIRIQDNGPGMPEAVRSHVFDPFFTTKPVGKGTGLGLSISYQIVVEKHEGQIICESTPEQGTTFIITLPLHTDDDDWA